MPDTLEEQTNRLGAQLQRKGLNPFDLLSWEDLVGLYVGTKHIYRQGIAEDAEGTKALLTGMWGAMVRKAQDYESMYATSERSDFLLELKNS